MIFYICAFIVQLLNLAVLFFGLCGLFVAPDMECIIGAILLIFLSCFGIWFISSMIYDAYLCDKRRK